MYKNMKLRECNNAPSGTAWAVLALLATAEPALAQQEEEAEYPSGVMCDDRGNVRSHFGPEFEDISAALAACSKYRERVKIVLCGGGPKMVIHGRFDVNHPFTPEGAALICGQSAGK